ncbi:DivIVA domain-containing protein [Micromonospora sp. NBC_01405]|uniref:DivIVA domain-containing protein n=1 Tax=Micromonospora sp. NBC_01405 TaxID=2903589 RepID=UPI003254CF4C
MSLRNQRPDHLDGATHRSSAYPSLLPWQVRERRFRPAGRGRRGLDPDDVYAFLDRVAADLAGAYAALGASRREAARLTYALCRREAAPSTDPDRRR